MSSDLDQALRVRQRARARRRNKRIAAAVVLVLVAAALGWLIGFSPLLVVRDVEVTGTALTSADDVVAAAVVPSGTPLARLDADEITGRVEQLATVADARLVRAWPSTVRIEVTERTVVYQVAQDSGYGQVDAEGVIFTTGADEQAAPVASLADLDDQELRADVATATSALPPAEREAELARFTAAVRPVIDALSRRDAAALTRRLNARASWLRAQQKPSEQNPQGETE